MNTILTIAKREFRAYFLSPIAYVYLITFLVISNWLFFRNFFVIGQADMRTFFSLMPWVFLFFIPAVSMGKWSEEKKLGTMELLLTLPVKDSQVVLGKFSAAFALILTALALTIPIPISVLILGNADPGPMISGYIGLMFMGAAYLAIGLFVSALTENQIIAFILGVTASFVLLIFGEPIFTASLPKALIKIFQYLGLGTHFGSIGRGVLDSRDIIYYISVIGFFLWLNLKAIEARSWK
jgi:ABC-2 type transport system permease protein